MTFEKEQRQKVHSNFITSSQDNFILQEEFKRLKKENERLAKNDPSEEDRFMERNIERARDETCVKCLADFEANIAFVEKKYDVEIVSVVAKYEEKCKELHILEAELEDTNKEVGDVGDENVDDENNVDAKKSKEVAQLKAHISEANVAYGDTVDTATRTRSNNTLKKSTKALSVKIKAFANMLKKKIAGHQDLMKDIALERKKNEDIMKQTTIDVFKV